MKNNFRRKLYFIALVFMYFLASPIHAITLVSNRQSKAVIVIPDNAIRPVRFAAEELQHHITRATGVKLPIVKESAFNTKNIPIYLGTCKALKKSGIDAIKFPPNGYLVKVTDNAVFFSGDDKDGDPLRVPYNTYARTGTAFAVYDFLENKMGIRWLWPGTLGEVIPKVKNLTIKKYYKRGKPRFAQTRMVGKGQFLIGPAGWSSSQAHRDYFIEESRWMRRHRFAQDYMPDGMTHPFANYWKKFGKTHPEFFQQMPDGRRGKDPTQRQQYDHTVSICVSSNIAQHRVNEWAKKRTPSRYLGAGENDLNGKCTCANCMLMDVPDSNLEIPYKDRFNMAREVYLAKLHNKKLNLKLSPDFLKKLNMDSRGFGWPLCLGSLSDRYASFWLNIQKLARKVDPDVYIWALAHDNRFNPPRKTKLNDHIIVAITPIYYFPFAKEEIDELRKSCKGWSDSGAKIFLRPNYILSGHNFPIFYARKAGADIAFAVKNNMYGAQYDSIAGQWGTQGINLYVIARMLEHPEMDVDEVLKEYYSAFGPAADAVKNYFEYWEKVANNLAKDKSKLPKTVKLWETFFKDADIIFTQKIMKDGRRLLEIARRKAKDSPAVTRVEFLSKGLRHAELTLEVIRARKKGTSNNRKYKDAIKELDNYRKSIEKDYVSNMTILYFNETGRGKFWPRNLDNTSRGKFKPGNALKKAASLQKNNTNWGFEEVANGQYNTLVPDGDPNNLPVANLAPWKIVLAPEETVGVVKVIEDGTAPEGKRHLRWISFHPLLLRQVKTVAGKKYRIRFHARTSGGGKNLTIYWNNTMLDRVGSSKWQVYTFELTGTGGWDTLGLQRYGNEKPFIDGLAVDPM